MNKNKITKLTLREKVMKTGSIILVLILVYHSKYHAVEIPNSATTISIETLYSLSGDIFEKNLCVFAFSNGQNVLEKEEMGFNVKPGTYNRDTFFSMVTKENPNVTIYPSSNGKITYFFEKNLEPKHPSTFDKVITLKQGAIEQNVLADEFLYSSPGVSFPISKGFTIKGVVEIRNGMTVRQCIQQFCQVVGKKGYLQLVVPKVPISEPDKDGLMTIYTKATLVFK